MRLPFFKKRSGKKRIHLDYASTTPVRKEVLDVMLPFFSDEWANPNAIYAEGVKARNIIEEARTRLARMLTIRAHDIIFTSGGTESNNLALMGFVEALLKRGRSYGDIEIIATKIEHPSILETLDDLALHGVRVTYVPVDESGLIDVKTFQDSLTTRTALVTFAYVNSEIGIVQDVKRLTRAVRLFNKAQGTDIRVHLDASQAPLWLPVDMTMLGIDLMTLDAGKCYGPKGVGVLAYRHGVSLAPQMRGGGQENGLRSGTENTPLIVGCVEALIRAQSDWKLRSEAVTTLRDLMRSELKKEIPDIVVNGSLENRVANNVNISIPGIDTEFAVITLDREGIAASTKSACGSGDSQGSTVVFACTNDHARADATLRFTLGEETTKEDILRAIQVLKTHVVNMKMYQARFSS